MTIAEILKERKNAVYKCEMLGVSYEGSKRTKHVLTDLIDYLPDTMGTIVDIEYSENADLGHATDVRYAMSEIMGNINTAKKRAVIKGLQIENLLNADIAKMSLSIIDTRPISENRVKDIVIHLRIFHREYIQVKDLSMIEININYYDVYDGHTGKIKLRKLTRWAFGNETVEKVLNRQHKLYEGMLLDWLYYTTKNGCTNYDEVNNILTYGT